MESSTSSMVLRTTTELSVKSIDVDGVGVLVHDRGRGVWVHAETGVVHRINWHGPFNMTITRLEPKTGG